MPYRDAKTQKEAQHRSYLRNRDKIKQKQKETQKQRNANAVGRRRKLCLWITEKKRAQGSCLYCKREFPPFLLDYHHQRGKKKCEIRTMANLLYSRKAISREIKKCDLICIICHRIIHSVDDRGWAEKYQKSEVF